MERVTEINGEHTDCKKRIKQYYVRQDNDFLQELKESHLREVAHSHRDAEGARWRELQRESPDVGNATFAFGEHRDQNDHSIAREIRWKNQQICEDQKVPHFNSGYFIYEWKIPKVTLSQEMAYLFKTTMFIILQNKYSKYN